ncbi:MAG TPA: hypothetical protein VHQ01_09680 [Pyrinomonadaceae bacterium]|nr:hypothetical protein [Pyrinomonadaceae bacterium]
MRSLLVSMVIITTFAVGGAFAQRGGKAEPKEIKFAPGRSSATLTGTLSVDEEMEYVFAARKGQKVTVTNSNTGLFDFKVYSEENFSEGDFDSSRTYTFEIPETGDYMFFVRKKRVKTPRTARFSLTLTIK